METFEIALIVLGALLVIGALLSGYVKRSFLSLTALYVLAGFALGQGGLGVLDFNAQEGFVKELAILALVVILFRDGLEVEAELLAKQWHLPLRKLIIAMPIFIVAAYSSGPTTSSFSQPGKQPFRTSGSSSACQTFSFGAENVCSPINSIVMHLGRNELAG